MFQRHLTPLVAEALGDTPVGLEVKASTTLQSSDFKGLKDLAELLGDTFHRGVVLYTGREVLPFGPKLWAVPVAGLWAGLEC